MHSIIVNAICAAIIIATAALCGGPWWGAFGFGAITFIIWHACDLICAKIDLLVKSKQQ